MHKSNLVGITHILWIDLSSWCLEFVTLPLFLDVVHLRSCTDSKNEPPVVGPFSFLCFGGSLRYWAALPSRTLPLLRLSGCVAS